MVADRVVRPNCVYTRMAVLGHGLGHQGWLGCYVGVCGAGCVQRNRLATNQVLTENALNLDGDCYDVVVKRTTAL